jgi:hypothetical protein
MEALSGRADVFATGRVRALAAELVAGFGSRVGNRSAALPAGLMLELAAGMRGSLPTGSGEVIVAWAGVVSGGAGDFVNDLGVCDAFRIGEVCCVGGAVMATLADAVGSAGRLAALPVTVRRTDVTVEAVTEVASCAWS